MKINCTVNISTNEVICFSSCALSLLLQLFMNNMINLVVRPGVQVILSRSLLEQAQSTWSIMRSLPWMTSLNFNQQKATRKHYLMNRKAEDILEGSFMAVSDGCPLLTKLDINGDIIFLVQKQKFLRRQIVAVLY
ncbi:hypothetical protein MKW98_025275 [Papaver atlanticum]|uniref:Uncharacterized protein n=1 Tax=Papaver atlanticum TaxID=357466 RepID=A0AAD4S3D0_9MAGN|nr:hypothetical protein MKW98_025275 [Papaver atlanticum]